MAVHPAARAFVGREARLQKSAKTVDAYARNLDDLLQKLDGNGAGSLLECGFEDVERYVEGLYNRAPRTQGRGGENVTRISGTKLWPATLARDDSSEDSHRPALLRVLHTGRL